MALVSFVVVGVSPRTLGRQHSDAVALLASPFIVWLRRVLGPVARVLVAARQRRDAGSRATATGRSRASPSCATWSTSPARVAVIEAGSAR